MYFLVTALEWSPDGKNVVLGFTNGTLSMYSMENCEEIYSCLEHEGSSITSLNW